MWWDEHLAVVIPGNVVKTGQPLRIAFVLFSHPPAHHVLHEFQPVHNVRILVERTACFRQDAFVVIREKGGDQDVYRGGGAEVLYIRRRVLTPAEPPQFAQRNLSAVLAQAGLVRVAPLPQFGSASSVSVRDSGWRICFGASVPLACSQTSYRLSVSAGSVFMK